MTKLDPCDKSKAFGAALDDLLTTIIELEDSDFRKEYLPSGFEDTHLTEEEFLNVESWYNGGLVGMPRDLLLKSRHPFAVASALWAMIADGEDL